MKISYFKFTVVIFSFLLVPELYAQQCQNVVADGQGPSDAYCMKDFEKEVRAQGVSQSNQMHKVLIKLPPHVIGNLAFKRGNNLSSKKYSYWHDGKTRHKSTPHKKGPFGHPALKRSKSATPWEPRVFVWDEQTGFTASWNGGNPTATTIGDHGTDEVISVGAHDRVDLYEFDYVNNVHKMWYWQPKTGKATDLKLASRVHEDQQSSIDTCFTCHGTNLRPIWPMYPDWPQFYGVYNDEIDVSDKANEAVTQQYHLPLAKVFQRSDQSLYRQFRKGNAKSSDRYKFLFDENRIDDSGWSRVNSWLNNWPGGLFEFYPFRPNNVVSPANTASRAFMFRPNLRLGVVYNRLVAREIAQKIIDHPMADRFLKVFLYALMDCNWSNYSYSISDSGNLTSTNADPLHYLWSKVGALASLTEAAAARGITLDLNGHDGSFGDFKNSSYTQVPYEEILKAFDLEIRDVDIRYKHNAGVMNGREVFALSTVYDTRSIMDLGYLKSGSHQYSGYIYDHKDFGYSNRSGSITYNKKYFNSYFDGSATTNELIAAILINHLIAKNSGTKLGSQLRTVRYGFDSLYEKYDGFSNRIRYDERFFKRVDRVTKWMSLPYPSALKSYHNRDNFGTSSGKGRRFYLNHVRACNAVMTNMNPDGESFYAKGQEILEQ